MIPKKSIKDWAEDDRPREKLQNKGVTALSDAELLAILIGSGAPKESAVDLARAALHVAGNNLDQMGKLGLNDLLGIRGIGIAKAITIMAAMELGRRRQMSAGAHKMEITGAKDVVGLLFPLLQDLTHERFCVLYLNNAQSLIKHEFLSSGGMTATVVDVRLILKNALLCHAAKIIVAHNHPSGNKKPSESDIRITQKIRSAAGMLDIALLDHIIIAGKEYTSFVQEGLL